MCILFIYCNKNASPGSYRLILASNRDEFYARPAKPAHFWDHQPDCLGGVDMEPGREGGTWLALNLKSGRAGVILNLTGHLKIPEAKGRGTLITDYLVTQDSSLGYANKLHKINQEYQLYNPYNLVLIDLRKSCIYYVSSILNFEAPIKFDEDILAFGNSVLEKPYKKVVCGKEEFKKIVENSSSSNESQIIDDLISFLQSNHRYLPDPELVKRSPNGFAELSSIFVKDEKAGYGTRTHSILLVDYNCKVTFVEETLMPDKTWKRQVFRENLRN